MQNYTNNFLTQQECMNLTFNCYGNAPDCQQTAAFDNRWSCHCYDEYDWNLSCKENVYVSTYQGRDSFYWVLGLFFTLPCTFAYILEASLHVVHSNWRNISFTAKVFSALVGILRIYYFTENAVRSITRQVPINLAIMITSQVVFWLAAVFGIIVYFLCTIMWLNLVLTIKNMSNKKTTQYKVTRIIYLVATIIFTPGAITLAVLLTTRESIIYGIYAVWISVPTLMSIIYCSIQVIFLHLELKRQGGDFAEAIMKKNYVLGVISVAIFIGIIILVCVELQGELSYFDYWVYLGYMTALRATETALLYLFLYFSRQYIFVSDPLTEATGKTVE